MDLYAEVVDPVPIEQDDGPDGDAGKEHEDSTADGAMAAAASTSSAHKAVDDRLKRRAKRPSKYLMKHLTGNNGSPTGAGQSSPGREGNGASLANGVRTAKNMRRPRNGYGRGLAKKGKASHLFLLCYWSVPWGLLHGKRVPLCGCVSDPLLVVWPSRFSPLLNFYEGVIGGSFTCGKSV